MCRISDEDYGIDISYVTDIIELQKITEVPDMPDYVKGVINLRGQVIPVIDLRIRFGMEVKEYDDRTVITVVKVADQSVGFIVDTATEVQEIPVKQIEAAPTFQTTKRGRNFISGLGKVGEEVKILLDVTKLVEDQSITAAAESA
ncbi:MAG TPA: purine-binding chemotaxis protein CheW [Sediminispirochaeta sp.]|nr:purine-binding chemotaxis protein CheW [Sediminispirochaeta sp.]